MSGRKLLDGIPVLEETPDTDRVIAFYMKHRLMPGDALGDAAHLAIASLHAIDFLLTWNCRHLANANKVPHIQALNKRLNLPAPILTTPFNLRREEH